MHTVRTVFEFFIFWYFCGLLAYTLKIYYGWFKQCCCWYTHSQSVLNTLSLQSMLEKDQEPICLSVKICLVYSEAVTKTCTGAHKGAKKSMSTKLYQWCWIFWPNAMNASAKSYSLLQTRPMMMMLTMSMMINYTRPVE